MSRIGLDALNAMSDDDFVAALGNIYEHAPWAAGMAAARRPYATVTALAEAMRDAVRQSSEKQMPLIAGHPELGVKAIAPLTSESRGEQASAGLDRLNDETLARFQQLNNGYRGKFGFPFIICVRRHSPDSILRQFERRLRNDPDHEREAALTEIFHIAALRLDEKVDGPGPLKLQGRLSTHVLDTHAGRPANGIPLTLCTLSDSGARQEIARATTNADGRTDVPLISGRPIQIGQYELQFEVGAYFAAQRAATADPAFLDTIPIRFSVAEAEGHYHVPLLVTPWSYSTYRGS